MHLFQQMFHTNTHKNFLIDYYLDQGFKLKSSHGQYQLSKMFRGPNIEGKITLQAAVLRRRLLRAEYDTLSSFLCLHQLHFYQKQHKNPFFKITILISFNFKRIEGEGRVFETPGLDLLRAYVIETKICLRCIYTEIQLRFAKK